MTIDRRKLLQLITTGALGTALPASISRALEIPANNCKGSIDDIEHIVVLMQENRSFDHYFGTLKGVRGYGDPRAVKLPSGEPIWKQPDGSGSYVLPFHPGAPDLGLKFLEDLAHDWGTTHAAWNNGNHDQWVPQKGSTTMAHLNRQDIPFHYALADAFTVCDAYHCSLLGPTDPNRYYMWTGWVGNDGKNGGPVIDNAEAGYDWSTYPERMQKAGVSWRIYQDVGEGLNAGNAWGWTFDNAYIGNYGDNSLLYFHQYQNAPENSPLAEKARTGTDISTSGTLFDTFRKDVLGGNLPQVSWIVAPEAYTEHPNWPANYGAWYVSQILDALTANPAVWSKTAFLLTYDENDGFFDHVVPMTVPLSKGNGLSTVDTVNEIFPGDSNYSSGPYGMGVRVPMLVISPWSKGGWVDSEVFDHTSIIRFIEKRFGKGNPEMEEPNITPWRRAVSGDLTSAFNFKTPNDAVVVLPRTHTYLPPDNDRHADYSPVPPTHQAMPVQEPGTRPARALPYELHVYGEADFTNNAFKISFGNTGKTAVYQVRSGDAAVDPRTYTVGTNKEVSDSWSISATKHSIYDLSVNGPNGFLRAFKGTLSEGFDRTNIHVRSFYEGRCGGIRLAIANHGEEKVRLRISNAYTGETHTHELHERELWERQHGLEETGGWYDFTVEVESDPVFKWQLAGHVETGKDSITDPLIGRAIE